MQTYASGDHKTGTRGAPSALGRDSHRMTSWTDVTVKDSNTSTIHKVKQRRQYLVLLVIGCYLGMGKGEQVGK